MASWQAHVLDALLRMTVKRRLRNNTDLASVRAVLGSGVVPVDANVTFRPHWLAGIAGEWITAPVAASMAAPGAAPGAAAGAALNPPAMLYLHGGGYFACSPRTHRPITAWFARAGFEVFAPEYRLAPEHPFPAAIEDAEAAYLGLLDAGHRAERIVVAGDSAGGGLALALLLRLRNRQHRLPAAASLFSPWTDLAITGASMRTNAHRDAMFWVPGFATAAAAYLGAADPRTPLASPLYGDLRGLPPMLIHAGAREAMLDDSTRLAEAADAAGVAVTLRIWPVVPHVWQLAHHFVPEARESLRQSEQFLRAKLLTGSPRALLSIVQPIEAP